MSDTENLHGSAPDKSNVALLLKENQHALAHIKRVLKADTQPSGKIDFKKLKSLKPKS